MLSQPVRVAVAVVVVGVGVGGCQPPAPTPVPVASYRCTPEAGGAEFDCSQRQFDEMVAKDELYAEAEAVYRKFFAENTRILRRGGISTPSPILLETTSGAFLDDAMDNYKFLIDGGLRATGKDPDLVRFVRKPGVAKAGSEVVATICVDGSDLMFEGRRGERAGAGKLTQDDTYFARVDGSMKVIGADGKVVESCG